jgi:hypothetical protein
VLSRDAAVAAAVVGACLMVSNIATLWTGTRPGTRRRRRREGQVHAAIEGSENPF